MDADRMKDLSWGAFLGILLAIGPLTGQTRLIPSVGGGLLFGWAVIVYRTRQRRDTRADASDAAPGRTFDLPGPLVWGLAGAIVFAFLPTLRWFWYDYTYGVFGNAHGLLLPPLLVMMARGRLRRDGGGPAESSAWGVPLLVLGLLLALLDSAARTLWLGAFGLLLTLLGLCLFILGARRTRLIRFPLCLSVFMLPSPAFILDPLFLTSTSVKLAAATLNLAGVEARVHDAFVYFSAGTILVSTHCSGLSAFYAGLLIALVLAAAVPLGTRKVFVLLATWPLVVGINAARLIGLIVLSNQYGKAVLVGPLHGMSGIATFWGVAILLYWIAGRPHLRRVLA